MWRGNKDSVRVDLSSQAAVLISSGVLFPPAALADEANVLEGLRSPHVKTRFVH